MPENDQAELSQKNDGIEVDKSTQKKLNPLLYLRDFCEKNSGSMQAMSAVATVILTAGLVYFANASKEIAENSTNLQLKITELQHKQFLIEQHPILQILGGESKLKIENDVFSLRFQYKNTGGGYARNIRVVAVLFTAGIVSNTDQINILNLEKSNSHQDLLRTGYSRVSNLIISDKKDTDWLKTAKENSTLFLNISIRYDIPDEISEGKDVRSEFISRTFSWSNNADNFFDIDSRLEDRIQKKLKDHVDLP